MKRQDYAKAIEQIIKDSRRPYVAVADAKKAISAGSGLRHFDFLVYMPAGDHLLVKVLPRSRPRATPVERADMVQWARVFGQGFNSIFVHAAAEPVVFNVNDDPPVAITTLRELLAGPVRDEPPAEPSTVPVCVEGQQVFDAGCVAPGVQLSMF